MIMGFVCIISAIIMARLVKSYHQIQVLSIGFTWDVTIQILHIITFWILFHYLSSNEFWYFKLSSLYCLFKIFSCSLLLFNDICYYWGYYDYDINDDNSIENNVNDNLDEDDLHENNADDNLDDDNSDEEK